MKQKEFLIIGLMSGTSLDGVDIVHSKFISNKDSYSFAILNCETFSYSEKWMHTLKNAFNSNEIELKELDIEYGKYLGELTNSFIIKNKINQIDFIASHGHTIFHKPEEGYTLQIGSGREISKITMQKVICDFRTQDVTLGGQGAPLVPIGDELLFSDYEYCLNLGGFANISFNRNGTREAFDICPVNIVMNHYAERLGFDYDNKGLIAAGGEIDSVLLDELNNIPFYTEEGPKSLGYEFVVKEIFPVIERRNLSEANILRTFIAHIVDQISHKVEGKGKILITGGGVYNEFLIEQLQKEISNKIIIPTKRLIDFKEALIFAFLGLRKNEGKVNCLKSVTGANRDHSSGVVYYHSK